MRATGHTGKTLVTQRPMGVQMVVEYEGDLRCRTTHGPSGVALATDAPTDNRGRGASFSPTDLLGAALGTCALTTLGIKAQSEPFGFAGGRATVEKHMTREGPRRVARLDVELELRGVVDRARAEAIAKTCPVALSLSPAIEVRMTFVYPPG